MKFTADLSLCSAPHRPKTHWTPAAVFDGGTTEGATLLASSGGVFTDLTGTTLAASGNSVARVDDLSDNANNAEQPSAALRPQFIIDGIGAALRLDGSDDKLSVAMPAGLTGDILVSGRKGSWIVEGASIAPAAAFDIGPLSFTGATPGILRATGLDIVGCTAIDRSLTASERTRLIAYHKKHGAKGLLIAGPDVVINGEFDADTDWTKGAGWSIAGGVASSTTDGTLLTATNSPLIPGDSYLVSLTVSAYTSGTLRFYNAGFHGLNGAAVGLHSAVFTALSSGFAVYSSAFVGAVSAISIRRLTAEEDL
jgi:hypothetical protein